ncbi:RagB/SusD family nutrient uptake outer membrane protein, partial [Bacteroides xylanisolvens]
NYTSIKSGESKFKCTFRTGELYLNSAEAAAHLNKLPEARTRLLKLIENRYTSEGYEQKKNEINAMSQEKLVTEILKERARELAFEGHRWFDLRRTTRPEIKKEIEDVTYTLVQDDSRYTLRIPQDAIDANPGLLN